MAGIFMEEWAGIVGRKGRDNPGIDGMGRVHAISTIFLFIECLYT